jgi:DMSO/TMAO reductase YedYZ molybdopterin-dependent catalytic subunit
MRLWSRRQFLGAAAALGVTQHPALEAGTKVLSSSPRISAQDFEQYPQLLTPASDLFVRNHFASPAIDLKIWEIQTVGAIERPLSLSFDNLRGRAGHTVTAVMECAGNGVGVGAVGCVEWKGPAFAGIISECRPTANARFVRLTGLDIGHEPGAGPVEIPYSRLVPIGQAVNGLVALEMNGSALSADHGAPARFLLPGSYGMNSVKWLRRIEVLEDPVADFFTDQRFRRVSGDLVGDSVGEIRVKSIIVQPKLNAALRGDTIRAGGYAWAGADAIGRVEVSVDSEPWRTANLLDKPAKYGWVPWEWGSGALRPGVHTVAARAFTASGQSQPPARDPLRQDEYELNQYQRIRFMIRP